MATDPFANIGFRENFSQAYYTEIIIARNKKSIRFASSTPTVTNSYRQLMSGNLYRVAELLSITGPKQPVAIENKLQYKKDQPYSLYDQGQISDEFRIQNVDPSLSLENRESYWARVSSPLGREWAAYYAGTDAKIGYLANFIDRNLDDFTGTNFTGFVSGTPNNDNDKPNLYDTVKIRNIFGSAVQGSQTASVSIEPGMYKSFISCKVTQDTRYFDATGAEIIQTAESGDLFADEFVLNFYIFPGYHTFYYGSWKITIEPTNTTGTHKVFIQHARYYDSAEYSRQPIVRKFSADFEWDGTLSEFNLISIKYLFTPVPQGSASTGTVNINNSLSKVSLFVNSVPVFSSGSDSIWPPSYPKVYLGSSGAGSPSYTMKPYIDLLKKPDDTPVFVIWDNAVPFGITKSEFAFILITDKLVDLKGLYTHLIRFERIMPNLTIETTPNPVVPPTPPVGGIVSKYYNRATFSLAPAVLMELNKILLDFMLSQPNIRISSGPLESDPILNRMMAAASTTKKYSSAIEFDKNVLDLLREPILVVNDTNSPLPYYLLEYGLPNDNVGQLRVKITEIKSPNAIDQVSSGIELQGNAEYIVKTIATDSWTAGTVTLSSNFRFFVEDSGMYEPKLDPYVVNNPNQLTLNDFGIVYVENMRVTWAFPRDSNSPFVLPDDFFTRYNRVVDVITQEVEVAQLFDTERDLLPNGLPVDLNMSNKPGTGTTPPPNPGTTPTLYYNQAEWSVLPAKEAEIEEVIKDFMTSREVIKSAGEDFYLVMQNALLTDNRVVQTFEMSLGYDPYSEDQILYVVDTPLATSTDVEIFYTPKDSLGNPVSKDSAIRLSAKIPLNDPDRNLSEVVLSSSATYRFDIPSNFDNPAGDLSEYGAGAIIITLSFLLIQKDVAVSPNSDKNPYIVGNDGEFILSSAYRLGAMAASVVTDFGSDTDFSDNYLINGEPIKSNQFGAGTLVDITPFIPGGVPVSINMSNAPGTVGIGVPGGTPLPPSGGSLSPSKSYTATFTLADQPFKIFDIDQLKGLLNFYSFQDTINYTLYDLLLTPYSQKVPISRYASDVFKLALIEQGKIPGHPSDQIAGFLKAYTVYFNSEACVLPEGSPLGPSCQALTIEYIIAPTETNKVLTLGTNLLKMSMVVNLGCSGGANCVVVGGKQVPRVNGVPTAQLRYDFTMEMIVTEDTSGVTPPTSPSIIVTYDLAGPIGLWGYLSGKYSLINTSRFTGGSYNKGIAYDEAAMKSGTTYLVKAFGTDSPLYEAGNIAPVKLSARGKRTWSPDPIDITNDYTQIDFFITAYIDTRYTKTLTGSLISDLDAPNTTRAAMVYLIEPVTVPFPGYDGKIIPSKKLPTTTYTDYTNVLMTKRFPSDGGGGGGGGTVKKYNGRWNLGSDFIKAIEATYIEFLQVPTFNWRLDSAASKGLGSYDKLLWELVSGGVNPIVNNWQTAGYPAGTNLQRPIDSRSVQYWLEDVSKYNGVGTGPNGAPVTLTYSTNFQGSNLKLTVSMNIAARDIKLEAEKTTSVTLDISNIYGEVSDGINKSYLFANRSTSFTLSVDVYEAMQAFSAPQEMMLAQTVPDSYIWQPPKYIIVNSDSLKYNDGLNDIYYFRDGYQTALRQTYSFVGTRTSQNDVIATYRHGDASSYDPETTNYDVVVGGFDLVYHKGTPNTLTLLPVEVIESKTKKKFVCFGSIREVGNILNASIKSNVVMTFITDNGSTSDTDGAYWVYDNTWKEWSHTIPINTGDELNLYCYSCLTNQVGTLETNINIITKFNVKPTPNNPPPSVDPTEIFPAEFSYDQLIQKLPALPVVYPPGFPNPSIYRFEFPRTMAVKAKSSSDTYEFFLESIDSTQRIATYKLYEFVNNELTVGGFTVEYTPHVSFKLSKVDVYSADLDREFECFGIIHIIYDGDGTLLSADTWEIIPTFEDPNNFANWYLTVVQDPLTGGNHFNNYCNDGTNFKCSANNLKFVMRIDANFKHYAPEPPAIIVAPPVSGPPIPLPIYSTGYNVASDRQIEFIGEPDGNWKITSFITGPEAAPTHYWKLNNGLTDSVGGLPFIAHPVMTIQQGQSRPRFARIADFTYKVGAVWSNIQTQTTPETAIYPNNPGVIIGSETIGKGIEHGLYAYVASQTSNRIIDSNAWTITGWLKMPVKAYIPNISNSTGLLEEMVFSISPFTPAPLQRPMVTSEYVFGPGLIADSAFRISVYVNYAFRDSNESEKVPNYEAFPKKAGHIYVYFKTTGTQEPIFPGKNTGQNAVLVDEAGNIIYRDLITGEIAPEGPTTRYVNFLEIPGPKANIWSFISIKKQEAFNDRLIISVDGQDYTAIFQSAIATDELLKKINFIQAMAPLDDLRTYDSELSDLELKLISRVDSAEGGVVPREYSPGGVVSGVISSQVFAYDHFNPSEEIQPYWWPAGYTYDNTIVPDRTNLYQQYNARWVSPPPKLGIDASPVAKSFNYTTEFDLTGITLNTVKISFLCSGDDRIVDIIVNGTSTGYNNISEIGGLPATNSTAYDNLRYRNLWDVKLPTGSGHLFVQTINTIDIVVENQGTTDLSVTTNPTGLYVYVYEKTGVPLPILEDPRAIILDIVDTGHNKILNQQIPIGSSDSNWVIEKVERAEIAPSHYWKFNNSLNDLAPAAGSTPLPFVQNNPVQSTFKSGVVVGNAGIPQNVGVVQNAVFPFIPALPALEYGKHILLESEAGRQGSRSRIISSSTGWTITGWIKIPTFSGSIPGLAELFTISGNTRFTNLQGYPTMKLKYCYLAGGSRKAGALYFDFTHGGVDSSLAMTIPGQSNNFIEVVSGASGGTFSPNEWIFFSLRRTPRSATVFGDLILEINGANFTIKEPLYTGDTGAGVVAPGLGASFDSMDYIDFSCPADDLRIYNGRVLSNSELKFISKYDFTSIIPGENDHATAVGVPREYQNTYITAPSPVFAYDYVNQYSPAQPYWWPQAVPNQASLYGEYKARWVSPPSTTGINISRLENTGFHYYKTTFNLANIDLETVKISFLCSGDDQISDIIVNGKNTGYNNISQVGGLPGSDSAYQNSRFRNLWDVKLPVGKTHLYVQTINTLTIVVQNKNLEDTIAISNPTGLYVHFYEKKGIPVPAQPIIDPILFTISQKIYKDPTVIPIEPEPIVLPKPAPRPVDLTRSSKCLELAAYSYFALGPVNSTKITTFNRASNIWAFATTNKPNAFGQNRNRYGFSTSDAVWTRPTTEPNTCKYQLNCRDTPSATMAKNNVIYRTITAPADSWITIGWRQETPLPGFRLAGDTVGIKIATVIKSAVGTDHIKVTTDTQSVFGMPTKRVIPPCYTAVAEYNKTIVSIEIIFYSTGIVFENFIDDIVIEYGPGYCDEINCIDTFTGTDTILKYTGMSREVVSKDSTEAKLIQYGPTELNFGSRYYINAGITASQTIELGGFLNKNAKVSISISGYSATKTNGVTVRLETFDENMQPLELFSENLGVTNPGSFYTTDTFDNASEVNLLTTSKFVLGQAARIIKVLVTSQLSKFYLGFIDVCTDQDVTFIKTPPTLDCKGNVNKLRVLLNVNGVPREEVNVFQAFCRYTVLTNTTYRTQQIVETTSTADGRAGTTLPTKCDDAALCNYWKQQGVNDTVDQLILTRTITDNDAAVDISRIESGSYNLLAGIDNWIWASPLNRGFGPDQYILQFPDTQNKVAEDNYVESLEIFLSANRAQVSNATCLPAIGLAYKFADFITVSSTSAILPISIPKLNVENPTTLRFDRVSLNKIGNITTANYVLARRTCSDKLVLTGGFTVEHHPENGEYFIIKAYDWSKSPNTLLGVVDSCRNILDYSTLFTLGSLTTANNLAANDTTRTAFFFKPTNNAYSSTGPNNTQFFELLVPQSSQFDIFSANNNTNNVPVTLVIDKANVQSYEISATFTWDNTSGEIMTDLTGESDCKDPADAISVTIEYINAVGAKKRFTREIALTELNTIDETNTEDWNALRAFGNGLKGDYATWASTKFELDKPYGGGLDQCLPPFIPPEFRATCTNLFGTLLENNIIGKYIPFCTPEVIVSETTQGVSQNEIQSLIVPISTGGFYTLTLDYNGSYSVEVPYNADAAGLRASLAGLPNIGTTSNVSVSGSGSASAPFIIEFTGDLALMELPLFIGNTDSLSSIASGTVIIITTGSTSERQRIINSASTRSPLILSFDSFVTGSIPYNASLNAFQGALSLIPSLGSQVSVSGNTVDRESAFTGPYDVDFTGGLAGQSQPALTPLVVGYSQELLWSGATGVNSKQLIRISATSGTFTITIYDTVNGAQLSATTAPISYNASDIIVSNYIAAAANFITVSDMIVTKLPSTSDTTLHEWTIEFVGSFAKVAVQKLVLNTGLLVKQDQLSITRNQTGFSVSEKQRLSLKFVTGGYYYLQVTVGLEALVTAAIPFDATDVRLEQELSALSFFSSGDVAVRRTPLLLDEQKAYVITFRNSFGDLPMIRPIYDGFLICDPTIQIAGPPYDYKVPICEVDPLSLSGYKDFCYPGPNDGASPLPDCCDLSRTGDNTIDVIQYQRELYNPDTRLNGKVVTVRQIAAMRRLVEHEFSVYSRDFTTSSITPISYDAVIRSGLSLLFVEKTVDTSAGLGQIVGHLSSSQELLPTRVLWNLK